MELLVSNKYPEYYTKVYGSFMKIYNCETEDSWLESNVADLVLSFKTNQDVPLRILSIGSGSGTDTWLFILMTRRDVEIRLSSWF